jgi:hypothetical protein
VLAVWIHFGRYVFWRQCAHDDADDYDYWYCHHSLEGSFFVFAAFRGRHFGHPILGVKACQSLCTSAVIGFRRACNSLCHSANPPAIGRTPTLFPSQKGEQKSLVRFAKKSEKKSGDEQTESGSVWIEWVYQVNAGCKPGVIGPKKSARRAVNSLKRFAQKRNKSLLRRKTVQRIRNLRPFRNDFFSKLSRINMAGVDHPTMTLSH